MSKQSQSLLQPRKSPVQARSIASVDAILLATLQVLLAVGKERLNTTRVAARAGVSVGTLYQYFPNKRALLRAALQHHMDDVLAAVLAVCHDQAGASLQTMAAALVTAFLKAKMKDGKTSVALYSVSSDVDGAAVVRTNGLKINRAIVTMLNSAQEELTTDPQLVASMVQASIAGASRRLLESASPQRDHAIVRDELTLLLCAYLRARSKPRS